MDYREFKKMAKNLSSIPKDDLKRALGIAKKLDDSQRDSFLEELEEKYQALNEAVEKTSAFVEDYSEFVTKSEKVIQKVETKEREKTERGEDVSQAEKNLSDYMKS